MDDCLFPHLNWDGYKKGCRCQRCIKSKQMQNDRYRKRRQERDRERRRKDPQYRLQGALRASFRRWLSGGVKKASVQKLIGCSLDDLWAWLLEHPDNKGQWTKENYGTVWHIDHAIPVSKFTAEQQAEAWHYTNLRPMDAKENMRKKNQFASIQF